MMINFRSLLQTRHAARQQAGQAVVIVAVAIVGLIGVAGLALDGGRAYVDHRALQGGADSAALSATQLVAYNLRVPGSKSDADVETAVANTVNRSRASGSDVADFPPSLGACDTSSTTAPADKEATCAWYTDMSGNLLLAPANNGAGLVAGNAVEVGNGVIPPTCSGGTDAFWGSLCTAGVALVPYYNHHTLFLGALGIARASERAAATAVFRPITTVQVNGFAHYAIANCIASVRPPRVGDVVTMRSNSWRSTYPTAGPCGLQGGLGSNNFKGWFHDPVTTVPTTSIPTPPPTGGCSSVPGPRYCGLPTPAPALVATGTPKTSFTELDYFSAKGGNAIGLEAADIAIIHSSWVSCHGSPPCHYILLPVMDYVSGGGSSIDMHIIDWVAASPDQDWNSPSQGDWTATVVGRVARRSDWTGCTGPSCPPPTASSPLSIQLYR